MPPSIEKPPGEACRVCERTTFQNPPVCLQCGAALNSVRKGNADRVLEQCLAVLGMMPAGPGSDRDSYPSHLRPAVELILREVQSRSAPHRLNDPNRHGRYRDETSNTTG